MLGIFLGVLAVMAFLSLIVGIVSRAIDLLIAHERDRAKKSAVFAAGGLAVALVITLGIYTAGLAGFGRHANAEHCGPGTRYISHYNAATKHTDWQCIADGSAP